MLSQQSPYDNPKRSIQAQMVNIQQQKANIARQKYSSSCTPEQRARLETQEAEYFKQERNLEQKMSSIERMEKQWLINQQKAQEAIDRQTIQRGYQQRGISQPQSGKWQPQGNQRFNQPMTRQEAEEKERLRVKQLEEETRRQKDFSNQNIHKQGPQGPQSPQK